jgi:hypothetical protein
MKTLRILVFPCGTEIGLEIHNSLKDIPFIELYGASSADDHGRYVFKRYTGDVPFIGAPGFEGAFRRILEENGIDYVFPAHDDVVLGLARLAGELPAKVLTSPLGTAEICRCKNKTYAHFKGSGFVPEIYGSPDEVTEFPVFLKPDVGQGSQGALKASDREQLLYLLSASEKDLVIQEYLSGEEFTVDCFTDRRRKLLFSGCRTRSRIRSGISVNSRMQPQDGEVLKIAEAINSRLELRGAWFFQLKRSREGALRLLEIAPRIAGTMCVQRAAGVNLPLLTVFDAMGYDVLVEPQFDRVEVDRALCNRYRLSFDFDELYVDFDDTIVTRGSVNTMLMMLLYQCVNKNIPVFLITKHREDIYRTLESCRISEKLFQAVIPVDAEGRKYTHIKPSPNALFVDDSFAERHEISTQLGIKALGVDALEALIDWKR